MSATPYFSLQILPMPFLFIVSSGQICLVQKLFRLDLCKVARKLALPTHVVHPSKTLTLKACCIAEIVFLRPPLSASQASAFRACSRMLSLCCFLARLLLIWLRYSSFLRRLSILSRLRSAVPRQTISLDFGLPHRIMVVTSPRPAVFVLVVCMSLASRVCLFRPRRAPDSSRL